MRADLVVPPILLVRLRPRLPGGERVVESRRVCHLVPVPESDDVPEVLRAYCGQPVGPGWAELLSVITGMPCEPCLAASPVPVFALFRTPGNTADPASDLDLTGWWDLGLRPEQKITARFVLLFLLHHPARFHSVAKIADRLGQEPAMVSPILLLHTAAGWAERTVDRDPPGYRLTTQGRARAARLLANGLTPTFTSLAAHLGLDTTVITTGDTA